MLNRLVKLLISLFYYPISNAAAVMRSITEQKRSGTFVVLTYHSVKPRQIGIFDRQMDLLVRAGKPVLADIGSPLAEGVHHIAVTFDDGFKSFAEYALPVLHRRNIPATLFVPIGYLGKLPGWIKNPQHENEGEILVSEDQLRALPLDMILIGSHSVTHSKLTSLQPEQARMELVESKKRLEAILGREVTLFSFPYNDYNDQAVEMAKQAGYSRVFSNVPTFPISKVDSFMLGRVDVSPDDWDIEYSLKLRGAYQWLPFAIAAKRKMKSLLGNISV